MRHSNKKLALAAVAVLGLSMGAGFVPSAARGNMYLANNSTGTVSVYSNAGVLVNANLFTTSAGLCNIAVSGSNLFVDNNTTGVVSQYTTSGTLVNANLITGYSSVGMDGLAVVGTNLFIATDPGGHLYEYTTSGTYENQWSSSAAVITAYGSNLLFTRDGSATIEEMSTAGTILNSSMFNITGDGTDHPYGLAVSPDGTDLYETDGWHSDPISEWNIGTGTAVNLDWMPQSYISGLAMDSVVPEPASLSLVALGGVSLLARRRRAA